MYNESLISKIRESHRKKSLCSFGDYYHPNINGRMIARLDEGISFEFRCFINARLQSFLFESSKITFNIDFIFHEASDNVGVASKIIRNGNYISFEKAFDLLTKNEKKFVIKHIDILNK